MYISTDKLIPMDSRTQTKLKELLNSFDDDLHVDKDHLRIVLNQWKDLLEKLGGAGEDTQQQREILKLIEDKISSSGRLTWDPTPYEYIVFYIVIAFIISVFGKFMPRL